MLQMRARGFANLEHKHSVYRLFRVTRGLKHVSAMIDVLPFFILLLCGAAVAAPPSPEAIALQAALDTAIAEKQATFTLPSGPIYFNGASFNISGAAGISIGGSPSPTQITTLVFTPGFGVAVSNGTGATLHDFQIDYSPLPYVYGQVTSATSGSLQVNLSATSLTFEELSAQYPPHDIYPPGTVFRGGDLVRPVCDWGRSVPSAPLGGLAYQIACRASGVEPGDVFVAATRVGITLSLSNCSKMLVRDVAILAASYMAVTEFQGDGGNVYQRVRIAGPSPDRPLGSNADGFHSSGARMGPRLEGVVIKGLLDDYFNVHNTLQLYIGPSWPGSAWHLVGDYQLFSGTNSNYGTQTTLDRVAVGESLSFFPLNTFTYPPEGSGTIASITRVSGASGSAAAAVLAAAYANASALAKSTPCSACHAGLNPFASAQLYNVSFSGPLGASVQPLSLVSADSIASGGAVITGCTFSDSASNLGRFKSSGGRIEGNTWARTVSQNLEIEPLQNWLEGPMGCHNVSVANNIFYGTQGSPVHTYGSVDVRQVNNSFLP